MTDDDKADEIAYGSTRSRTPWKAVAIVLALVLGVVLICAAAVVADLTDLALSLLKQSQERRFIRLHVGT